MTADNSTDFVNAIVDYAKILFHKGCKETTTRLSATPRDDSLCTAFYTLRHYYFYATVPHDFERTGEDEEIVIKSFMIDCGKAKALRVPLDEVVFTENYHDRDGLYYRAFSLPAHRHSLDVFHCWLMSVLDIKYRTPKPKYSNKTHTFSYNGKTLSIEGSKRQQILDEIKEYGYASEMEDGLKWKSIYDATRDINRQARIALGTEVLAVNIAEKTVKHRK